MAAAIRASLEEERERAEARTAEGEPAGLPASLNEEDALMERALQMSMQEFAGASAEPVDMAAAAKNVVDDEDAEMARALAMSMEEASSAAPARYRVKAYCLAIFF